MNEAVDRLRDLLADQLEDWTDDEVRCRVEELEEVADAAGLDAVEHDVRDLSALSSETRYRIVRLLGTADDELCVCEIAPWVDVSSSAVSHALSDLTDAGLLERRKKGRWRYYRTTERAEALLAALDRTGQADSQDSSCEPHPPEY